MTTISGGAGISSAMGSAVLALQNTQSAIDKVQLRLASGLRVNSALDNPGSYFTARSLSHRAASLGTALDRITASLGTLNQADTAITSLQSLISDAQAIVEQAQEVFSGSTLEASITGSRSLANITDLTTVSGIANNDRVRFRFIDSTGAVDTANSVSITAGDSISDFINDINAIADLGEQVFEASLDSAGQLTITRTDNTRWDLQFEDNGGAANTQLASALGFGGFDTTNTANGTSQVRITVLPTPSLTSVSLFAVGGTAAQASTSLRNLTDTSGGAAGDIFDGDANDAIKIAVNGGSYVTVASSISANSVQTLLDGINNNGSLNSLIAATFDTGTATINIRAIDDSVTSIHIQLAEDAAGAGTAGKIDLQQLGFGTRVLQSGADGSSATSSESFLLNGSAADLAGLEVEYNSIRTQIDELVKDSEFDGVNILNGDDLTTYFNPDASSSLVTQGDTLDSEGLGITEANFGTSSTVADTAEEIDDALDHAERFASGLSNDLSIIETRQDFIQNTINTLNEGADDLTVADSNEDGASLLALQTRLLVGVTGLALGAQAQASTLRLF